MVLVMKLLAVSAMLLSDVSVQIVVGSQILSFSYKLGMENSAYFFLLDMNIICVTFHLWINQLIKRKDYLLILCMGVIFHILKIYIFLNLMRLAQILNKESLM